MRQAFFDALHEIMTEDDQVILLNSDTGAIVLDKIKCDFPDRCINVGIAEQNMIGIAAGLALSGKIVYTYALLPFVTMRCYEQIRVDVCCTNLPVRMVGVGAGLDYNTLGPTHHGLEDIALMRALPNMTIFSPADRAATKALAWESYKKLGPVYIRLDRYGRDIYSSDQEFTSGLNVLKGGDGIHILATGEKVHTALLVSDELEKHSIKTGVIDVYELKIFDPCHIFWELLFHECITPTRIITLEEHSLIGGLSSIVAEYMVGWPESFLLPIGLPDRFCREYGSREFLQSLIGLDVHSITEKILNWLGKGTEF